MAERTITYEPPVFITTALAVEADMRDVAGRLGLNISIRRRGWLYRALYVTISGPDEVLDQFPIELSQRLIQYGR